MSKLYFKALKELPNEFIDEKTRCCETLDGKIVVAANPKYHPIIYKKNKGWKKLEIKQLPKNAYGESPIMTARRMMIIPETVTITDKPESTKRKK